MKNTTHAYVARCKYCERAITLIADDAGYASEVAESVARCIRLGFRMERLTLDEARRSEMFHTEECPVRKTNVQLIQTVKPLFPDELVAPLLAALEELWDSERFTIGVDPRSDRVGDVSALKMYAAARLRVRSAFNALMEVPKEPPVAS